MLVDAVQSCRGQLSLETFKRTKSPCCERMTRDYACRECRRYADMPFRARFMLWMGYVRYDDLSLVDRILRHWGYSRF